MANDKIQKGPIHKRKEVTILNGQTESSAVDLQGLTLIAIETPAALTGTQFEFKASDDGVTYLDYYNTQGIKASAQVGVDRYVAFAAQDFASTRFLKVVSNAAEGADRTIQLVARTV